jgi:hypothetical protein
MFDFGLSVVGHEEPNFIFDSTAVKDCAGVKYMTGEAVLQNNECHTWIGLIAQKWPIMKPRVAFVSMTS